MVEPTNLIQPTEEELRQTIDSKEGTVTQSVDSNALSEIVKNTPVEFEDVEYADIPAVENLPVSEEHAMDLAGMTTFSNPDYYSMSMDDAFNLMRNELISKANTYSIDGTQAASLDAKRNIEVGKQDSLQGMTDAVMEEQLTPEQSAEILKIETARKNLESSIQSILNNTQENIISIANASGIPTKEKTFNKKELREYSSAYNEGMELINRYSNSAIESALKPSGEDIFTTVLNSVSYGAQQAMEAGKGISRERMQQVSEAWQQDPRTGIKELRKLTEEAGFNSLPATRQSEILNDIFNGQVISRTANNIFLGVDAVLLGMGSGISRTVEGTVGGSIAALEAIKEVKPFKAVKGFVKEEIKALTKIPSDIKLSVLAAKDVGYGNWLEKAISKEAAPAGKGLLKLKELPEAEIVVGNNKWVVRPSNKEEVLQEAMEAIQQNVSTRSALASSGYIKPELAPNAAFAEIKGYAGTEVATLIPSNGVHKVEPQAFTNNQELDVVDVFVDSTTGRGFGSKEEAISHGEMFNVEGAKVIELPADNIKEAAKARADQKALIKEDLEIHDALTALTPSNIQANLVRPDTNKFDGKQLRKLINVLNKTESVLPVKNSLINKLEEIAARKDLTHNDIREVNTYINAYKTGVKEHLDETQRFIEDAIKPRYGLAVERKIFPSVDAHINIEPKGIQSKVKRVASWFSSSKNFLDDEFFKELNMSMSIFRSVEKPLEQLRELAISKLSVIGKAELDGALNKSVSDGRWYTLDELDDVIVSKDSKIIQEVKDAYQYLHFNNDLSLSVINDHKYKTLANTGFHSANLKIPSLGFEYDGNVVGHQFSIGQTRGLLSGKNSSILFLDFADKETPLKRIVQGGYDNVFKYNKGLDLTIDEASMGKYKIIEFDEPVSLRLKDGSTTVNKYFMIDTNTSSKEISYVARALDREQVDRNAFPRHIKNIYTHFVGQADIFEDPFTGDKTIRNDKTFLAFYSKKQAEEGKVKLQEAIDTYKKSLEGSAEATYDLNKNGFVTKWRVAVASRVDGVPASNKKFMDFMAKNSRLNLDTPVERVFKGSRTLEYQGATKRIETNKVMDFSTSEAINPYKKVRTDEGIFTVDFSQPEYDNPLKQLATYQSMSVFGIEKEELLTKYMEAWTDKANELRLFGDEARVFNNRSDKIKTFMNPTLQGSIVASQSGAKEELLAVRRALLNYMDKTDIYSIPNENFFTDILSDAFGNAELPKFVKSALFGMTYSKVPSAMKSLATNAMIGCLRPFQYIGGMMTAMQLSVLTGDMSGPIKLLAAYAPLRNAIRNGITDREAMEVVTKAAKYLKLDKQELEVATAILRYSHLGERYNINTLRSPSRGLERAMLDNLGDISLLTFTEGNIAQNIGGALTAAKDIISKYGKDATFDSITRNKEILSEAISLTSRYSGGLDKTNPTIYSRGVLSFPLGLIAMYPMKLLETILGAGGPKATLAKKAEIISKMAAVSTIMLGTGAVPLMAVGSKVPYIGKKMEEAYDRMFIKEDGSYDAETAAKARGVLSYMAWLGSDGKVGIDMADRSSIFTTTGSFLEDISTKVKKKDFVTLMGGPTLQVWKDPINKTLDTLKIIGGSEDITEDEAKALAYDLVQEAFVESIGSLSDVSKAYYIDTIGQFRNKKGQVVFDIDKKNAIYKALGLTLAQEQLYNDRSDITYAKYQDKEQVKKIYEESLNKYALAVRSGDTKAANRLALVCKLHGKNYFTIAGPFEWRNTLMSSLRKNAMGQTLLESNHSNLVKNISQDPRDAEAYNIDLKMLSFDNENNMEGNE